MHAYGTKWAPHISTSCGAISADGTLAAAGDWNGLLYVWDLRAAQRGKGDAR